MVFGGQAVQDTGQYQTFDTSSSQVVITPPNSKEHFLGKLGLPKNHEFKNKALVTEEQSTEPGIKKTATLLVPEGRPFEYRYTYNDKDSQGEYSAVSQGSINYRTSNTLSATFPHTGLKLERGDKITDSNGNTFYKLKVHIPENYKGAIEIDALYGKAIIFSDFDQAKFKPSKIEPANQNVVNQSATHRYDNDPPPAQSIVENSTSETMTEVLDNGAQVTNDLLESRARTFEAGRFSDEVHDDLVRESFPTFDRGLIQSDLGDTTRRDTPTLQEIATVDFDDHTTMPRRAPITDPLAGVVLQDLDIGQSVVELQYDKAIEGSLEKNFESLKRKAGDLLADFGTSIFAKIYRVHEAELGSYDPTLYDQNECLILTSFNKAPNNRIGDFILQIDSNIDVQLIEKKEIEGMSVYSFLNTQKELLAFFTEKTLKVEIENSIKNQLLFPEEMLSEEDISSYMSIYYNYDPKKPNESKVRGQMVMRDDQGRLIVEGSDGAKLVLFDPFQTAKSVNLSHSNTAEAELLIKPELSIDGNSAKIRTRSFDTVI